MEKHVGRAGRGAKAVMHAGLEDAVGLGGFRLRELFGRKSGLQMMARISAGRTDANTRWQAQAQSPRRDENPPPRADAPTPNKTCCRFFPRAPPQGRHARCDHAAGPAAKAWPAACSAPVSIGRRSAVV